MSNNINSLFNDPADINGKKVSIQFVRALSTKLDSLDKDCMLTKITTMSGLQIGCNYEKAITNQMPKEDLDPETFETEKPKGKTWVYYPVLLKADTGSSHYLKLQGWKTFPVDKNGKAIKTYTDMTGKVKEIVLIKTDVKYLIGDVDDNNVIGDSSTEKYHKVVHFKNGKVKESDITITSCLKPYMDILKADEYTKYASRNKWVERPIMYLTIDLANIAWIDVNGETYKG